MTRTRKLGNNGDIRRLLLISAGVVVLFELILVGLNFVLDVFYSGAVGLDGLRTRAMLDTARYVVEELGVFLLPFWQIAVIRVAMCKHRGRELDRGMLMSGFYRFGPVLVQNILMILVLVVACIACIQAASILYTQTPRGQELGLWLTEQIPANGDILAAYEQIPVEELLPRMAPVLVVAAVLGIPAVYFVWCKFRLAKYLVMDDERIRALPAMLRSFRLTRRQFFRFMSLDLSLWWYHLAVLVALGLNFVDLLLPFVGVKLSAWWLPYAALGVSCLARLLVAWGLQYKAELKYAAFYDSLKPPKEETE